ncbi:histidine kinase [Chryseolinea sp. T2]|uniref:tetratricopeptide repeat-containing sensor histidine kinase n=1 Tax=Chryseolinea sp. T2 TaxID=3129255 RepID=UPI003076DC9F
MINFISRYLLLFCTTIGGLLFSAGAFAQHTLIIKVNAFRQADKMFLAGSLNNWNPADSRYALRRINYFRWEIVLTGLAPGEYAFKLTKGSNETIETTGEGDDIINRIIRLRGDTTVLFSVGGWKDELKNPERFSDSARLASSISNGYKYLNINTDSSYKYALQTFERTANVSILMKAYAVNLQGEVLVKLGNTDKALELFQEGLKMRLDFRTHNDSGSVAYLYNQIGNVYWLMKDTLNAVQNYRRAMRWTQPYVYYHPFHETICNRLCNMGRACLGRKQLDSAKWYAMKASEVGDKVSAITDLFRGDISQAEHNLSAALLHYHDAFRLGIHHDDNYNVALQSYQRITALFEEMNQIDSALIYARRAFKLSNTLRNYEAISASGTTLARLFEDRGQFDSALFYQKQVIESGSRQVNQERERRALDTYFNEKIKEQETAARKRQQSSRFITYGLVLVFAIVVLFGVRHRIRLKSGYDKRMKEIEMRALRAQMNPHFIFNCLGSINRYIVKSDTRTASNYLTKFAKLIRMILDNSTSDHISLEAEMQTLQLYLEMESLRFDGGFEFEIETDENLQDTVQLPSMLIQPYVENAIWHGLLHKEEKGKLWLRFRKVNGHILQAEIEDNGIGRRNAAALKSKSSVTHKSYGMQISSERIQIINNLYKLNNSVTVIDLLDGLGGAAGTKIIINIPIS